MTVKFEEYEDAVINDVCFLKPSLKTTIHRKDSQAAILNSESLPKTKRAKILTLHCKKQTSVCDITADEWVNYFSLTVLKLFYRFFFHLDFLAFYMYTIFLLEWTSLPMSQWMKIAWRPNN